MTATHAFRWAVIAALLGAVLVIVLATGEDRRHPVQTWARAASDAVGGDAAGTAPVLAFRYRGKLCGVHGCLAETIVALCRSPHVDRLLERIEPLGGPGAKVFRGVQATLVAIPPRPAPDTAQTTGQLASVPFLPEKAWEWSGALPRWPNSCRSVSR